ncbi:MAG: putative phage abortive infection protein [Bacteroidetes bacterium]|nr:putative phage abortive infection protein [Bacteroidota bacterium]
MKKFINFIEKNLVKIAIYTLILGVLTILIFTFKTPFNDWSFNADPELFGLYGNFIGGFVGTLFSLVAVFFLYKTLIAQQRTLNAQDNAIKNQQENYEIIRFETTFFNLLKTQQEITVSIKSCFNSLNNDFSTKIHSVNGREFFAYSKSELTNILNVIDNDNYLGTYDESEIEYYQHEVEELTNPDSLKFTADADNQAMLIFERVKLRLTNKQYQISKDYWEQVHETKTVNKLEASYGLFFQRYHYVIGHYFRHLYHLINFVHQFENSKSDFKGISKKYIDFIQAQMSSYEMMLLFYNAISFPKLLKLLITYNFLENLAVEDLIDKTHNCISGVNLKERKRLLGYD